MHRFQDFKGFANAELNLFRPLTVLIGPNGSGKSNIVEGIKLFSYVASGGPLSGIVDVGRSSGTNLVIRGGLQSCPRYGKDSFVLSFSGIVTIHGEKKKACWEVEIQVKPRPFVASERLYFLEYTPVPEEDPEDSGDPFYVRGEIDIFRAIGRRQQWSLRKTEVEYKSSWQDKEYASAQVGSDKSVISQYHKFAEDSKLPYDYYLLVDLIINFNLKVPITLNPDPALIRGYERISGGELMENGSNLSAVLYALSEGTEDQKTTLNRLADRIAQLPDEPYGSIDFVRTDLDDVIFGFKDKETDRLVDARLLSDGTLRTLAVLTALETVAQGSLLIIEEFDNGLHPSRIQMLTEALSDCCTRRGIRVLVTTHNPATLDALNQDQLDGVVMCVWDKELKAFNLVRLADLPQYVEILESGRLGDLVTRRAIERYLEPNFEEDRTREALEWLDSLG